MSYPTIDIKDIRLKLGESFTIRVEGEESREVFVWLHKDGVLSFFDENFDYRPNAETECMLMDKERGWIQSCP